MKVNSGKNENCILVKNIFLTCLFIFTFTLGISKSDDIVKAYNVHVVDSNTDVLDNQQSFVINKTPAIKFGDTKVEIINKGNTKDASIVSLAPGTSLEGLVNKSIIPDMGGDQALLSSTYGIELVNMSGDGSNNQLDNLKIKATYPDIGTYNGKSVRGEVTFSDFTNGAGNKYSNLILSDNFYKGYVYTQGTGDGKKAIQYHVSFSFFDENNNKLNMDNNFMNFGSLNVGEFAGQVGTNDFWVNNPTNVIQSNNNNGVLVATGANNNFSDWLGSTDFNKNTVAFALHGDTNEFIAGAGWIALSTGIMTPYVRTPTKEVTNSNGKNMDNQNIFEGQKLTYKLKQNMGTMGVDLFQSLHSLQFKDTLDSNLQLESVELKDSTGKTYDLDQNGTYTYDKTNNSVTYSLNSNVLNDTSLYNGRDLYLQLDTKVKSSAQPETTISNQGKVVVNTKERVTNTVKSKVIKSTLNVPTKTVPSEYLINGKYPTSSTVPFDIKQKVNTLDSDIGRKYNSFEFNDTLEQDLNYQKAVLYDGEGKDVTASAGTLTYDNESKTVKYVFNDSYLNNMPMDGETYTLRIYTNINKHMIASHLISNTGTTIIDGNSQNATATISPVFSDTKLVKKFTTPTDKNGIGIVDSNNHIDYRLDTDIGNGEAIDNLTISDQVPASLKIVSAKVYLVNDDNSRTDITAQGSLSTTNGNVVWSLNKNGTSNIRDQLVNSSIQVDISTTVNPIADFSEYRTTGYDAKVPNSYTLQLNSHVYKSNIVYFSPNVQIPTITKSVSSTESGSSNSVINVPFDKKYSYNMTAVVGNTVKLKNLQISDQLETPIKYAGNYTVIDLSENNKDISDEGKFNSDESKNLITWSANDPQKFAGHTIQLQITTKVNGDTEFNKYVTANGVLIPNSANLEENNDVGDNPNSNQVYVKVPNKYTITPVAIKLDTSEKPKGKIFFKVTGDAVGTSTNITQNNSQLSLKLGGKTINVPVTVNPQNSQSAYFSVDVNADDILQAGKNSLAVEIKNKKSENSTDYNFSLEPTEANTNKPLTTSLNFEANEYAPDKYVLKDKHSAPERVTTYLGFKDSNLVKVQRILQEETIFNYNSTVSAKTGYGIKNDTSLVYYGRRLSSSTESNDDFIEKDLGMVFSTDKNLHSKQSNIENQTEELLDYSSVVKTSPNTVEGLTSSDLTKLDSYNALNSSEQSFVDNIDNEIGKDELPVSYDVTYRFNKRLISIGKGIESYDASDKHIEKESAFLKNDKNSNEQQRSGGYKFYTNPWLPLGNYMTHYTSQETIGSNSMKIKLDRNINFYGHQYLAKETATNDASDKYDEIGVQPVLSGKDAQDVEGFSKSDEEWLKNNN